MNREVSIVVFCYLHRAVREKDRFFVAPREEEPYVEQGICTGGYRCEVAKGKSRIQSRIQSALEVMEIVARACQGGGRN